MTGASKPHGLPTSASGELLADAPLAARLASAALVALVAAFFGWAALASIDEVVVAQGRVIPARKIQVVQSLEGGIVGDLLTSEGALVAKGDLLLRIDDTGFGSDLEGKDEQILGLKAKAARLTATIAGSDQLEMPAEVTEQRPDLARQQRQEFEARRSEAGSALSALAREVEQRLGTIGETEARIRGLEVGLTLAESELELTSPLVRSGAAARVELIRLESRIAELAGDLEVARLSLPRLAAALAQGRNDEEQQRMAYRADALKELSTIEVELSALEKLRRGQADKVARTEVRSPVRGIVKRLHVNTIGQVLKPAADIVEIVPLDDTLLVEARVGPRDVAFLSPGMSATVKLTAYDYTIYGTLKGRVERIGADAIVTERGDSYFLLEVRTDNAYIEKNGRRLPIMPGMIAEANMLTGRKTVLQYLIKPLTRLGSEAMRER